VWSGRHSRRFGEANQKRPVKSFPQPERSRPPEASARALAVRMRLVGPIERFLHIEASAGIVLLACALFALGWANSPWSAAYHAIWHLPIGFRVGDLAFERDLHFWINDGLMVVFFFVVGLEIRRELHAGELSTPRRAALPVIAALGGMLAPALIYLGLNPAPPSRLGWGIPTATDIAFAVGVLALLGRRVPSALRVLLLALAIIDDIGAILIIAIFYSSGVAASGLLIAGAGVLAILLLQRFAVRQPSAYLIPALVIWGGMLRSGIHPTIGGVVVGLLTPVRPWFGREGFLHAAGEALVDFRERVHADESAHQLVSPLQKLNQARREAVSPVVRLETGLHPWVAYAIMPLFALANAGVTFDQVDFGDGAIPVALGVGLGLVAGKPLGILLASLLGVRLGIAALPRGIGFKELTVVGTVAGIGFTMSLFVAQLAFRSPGMLGVAKLAVLVGSGVSAVLGLACGWLLLHGSPRAAEQAPGPSDAEASTEA
jgi:Na+:H+ antiporter, NhaA family